MPYGAVIVAGGASTRFGPEDKTAALLHGVALLDHVRRAVAHAAEIVVVGPEVQGGPLAAIGAGLDRIATPEVFTLAADLPGIAGAVEALQTALAGHDVAVLTVGGRRQYLAAIWRRESLVAALGAVGNLTDQPVRRVFDGVRVAEVEDVEGWSRDIDTPDDLAAH